MLPKEFLPYDVDNSELYRIGPNKDGGYVIHKKTIFYSKEILTFGLFNDWNFCQYDSPACHATYKSGTRFNTFPLFFMK